jgi:branched-chain amino acid transport system substrate-binding protein
LRAGTTALALLAVIGMSACAGKHSAAQSTVRIGMIAALSGPLQPIGQELRAGFQLYLDTHGGKLGGRQAELLVADEGDGPATAGPAAQKLVKKDRVLAVTGLVNAAALQSVAAVTTPAKVPLIGSCGRPTTLPDVSWVWHTSWISTQPGQAIASYVKSHVDGPVFVIGPDYQGGKDQINGFVDEFAKLDGKIANEGGVPTYTPYPSTSNFSPWLSKIKASGAKAVYTFYAGTNAVSFVKQYDQFGLKDIPLYASGALTEGALLKAEGQAATGIQTVAPYAADLDNATNRTFVDAYQQHFQTAPTYNAMTSWDAAAVLDRAVAAAGANPTSAAINKAMGKLGQIDSPRGSWQFATDSHTPVQRWYLRNVHSDGTVLSNVVMQNLTVLGS